MSAEKGNQEVSEVVPARDNEKLQEDHQQLDHDSDVEDDVVPIVIRPGHIRFGPLRKGLMLCACIMGIENFYSSLLLCNSRNIRYLMQVSCSIKSLS